MSKIEKALRALPDEIEIQSWSGASGTCLYVNNFRVVGPEPWGGSPAKTWNIPRDDFLRALRISLKEPTP